MLRRTLSHTYLLAVGIFEALSRKQIRNGNVKDGLKETSTRTEAVKEQTPVYVKPLVLNGCNHFLLPFPTLFNQVLESDH